MKERELLLMGLADLGVADEVAADRLLRFSGLLLEKNRVMNLTAVNDPCEVVTRHFLDCAVLAPLLPEGAKVVDVGCGAGFPGVPLALLTNTEVTLLDSLKKRIQWLAEVCETIPIPNAHPVHARAEEFGCRECFDATVSRAVARLNVLAELSLPLVRVGGCFLAMKASGCADEVAEAQSAVEKLGGEISEVRTYTVPQTDQERCLVWIRKKVETPPCYPRRFAKISAHPL